MLLAVLCFLVGATAFAGGLTLVVRPDGSLLQLPLATLAHSPFESFLVPGLLLAGVVGLGNLIAGALILRHSRRGHLVAFGAGVALVVWILAQMILLRTIDGLQITYLAAGIAIAVEAVRRRRWFAVLALLVAGCADHAMVRSEYDDVAHIAGAHLATPDRGGEVGALADAITIAQGGLPKGFTFDANGLVRGEHAGVSYRYFLTPEDATSAIVVASWSGRLEMPGFTTSLRRQVSWHLHDVTSAMGSASGTSSLMDQRAVFPDRTYAVTDAQDMLLFVDMASHDMMAGGLRATLAVTTDPDEAWAATRDVVAEVTFGEGPTARLVLDDDFVYDVDLANGAITRR